MTVPAPWKDDLFREKSLWDVFKASRAIERSKFNVLVMRGSSFLAFSYVLANAVFGVENSEVTASISRVSGSLLTITTAILGFLVTGFSIFVASTPRQTLRHLEDTRYRDSEISYFKQVMFNFLNVFTVFLCSMALSLGLYVVTPLGWIPPLSHYAADLGSITPVLNSFILAITCLVSVYSILRLKSFIWSLYQSIVIALKLSD